MTWFKAGTPRLIVGMAALVASGCGTLLPHNQIVGDAQGTVVPGGTSGPAQSTGAGAGSNESTGQIGSAVGSAGQIGTVGSTVAGSSGSRVGSTNFAVSGAVSSGAAGTTKQGAIAPGGTAASPIVIGTVGDYSGLASSSEAPALQALQVWVSYVNSSGGINGHKIKLYVDDDAGSKAQALSEAEDLVQSKHVAALVDSFASLTIDGWASYMDQAHVPVIGGDCNNDAWNSNAMLFPQCQSVDSEAWTLLTSAARYGQGKKLGLLYCVESATACGLFYNRTIQDGWAQKAGLNPVYSAQISLAQPDFTAQCLQARQDGVELLLVAADANTVSRVGSSCNRQGYSPQFLEPDLSIDGGSVTQPDLGTMLSIQDSFPFAGLSQPAAVAQFHSAWQTYESGQAPGPGSAQGWAGAELFAAAVGASGSNVTSSSLLQALWAMKGQGLNGLAPKLSFSQGHSAPDASCGFVMIARSGSWTTPLGDQPFCPGSLP